MKLSIVIPVYNEVAYIERVIERVRNVKLPDGVERELIIIDDCSKDGTRDKLQAMAPQPDVKLLFHEKNQGKGGALHTGFAAATGDYVLIQDADLEYDPAEIPRLLKPVLDGNADVVFGSCAAAWAVTRCASWPW